MTQVGTLKFPVFSGIRCLMMPYRQGDPDSVPDIYAPYRDIVKSVFLEEGEIGFLTIDESPVEAGNSHRGARSRFDRPLHTEGGRRPDTGQFAWGGSGWGSATNVWLDPDVQVLLANNLTGSCAYWDAVHPNTSYDGDIGDFADEYPYETAIFMGPGEVHQIGVLTPHESVRVKKKAKRQFLRVVGSGVTGREEYFTENPLLSRHAA